MNEDDDARFLVGAVLDDLSAEGEAILLLAQALDDRAAGITPTARAQQLRETAALVKSAALQLIQAAATIVGTAERLRLVAEFHELADTGRGGALPS